MTRATPIPDTVTLHVPFRFVKRGGRKEMQLPQGATQPRRTDSTLVKALARAFRWKRMLESGDFANGGIGPYEHWYGPPHENQCGSVRRDANSQGGIPTERVAMGQKLCDFLDAAWNTPEPILFLSDYGSQSGDVPDQLGRGPRYECRPDDYCQAIVPGLAEVGLERRDEHNRPVTYTDLFHLDRLPVIEEAMRKRANDLRLEIDLVVKGAGSLDVLPDTVWDAARRKALAIAQQNGIESVSEPRKASLAPPAYVYEASAVAARMIDAKTGDLLTELELAVPEPLPDGLLEMPASHVRDMDLLGIRLGSSFDDAEKLIREHMEVGRVMIADRSAQLGSISGNIEPYTSGRMFVSADGSELIAIYDEPPAAPGVVLGAWRILSLPSGGINPGALKTSLQERYGAPTATEEVYVGMAKGVSFQWSDFAPERDCGKIEQMSTNGLWRDEETGAEWTPPFFGGRRFPTLGTMYYFREYAPGERPPLSSFCPPILAVNYVSFPGVSEASPTGEITAWLSDQRDYARRYFESLAGQQPTESEAKVGEKVEIKF